MKKYSYLFLSLIISAGLVFLLLKQVKPADFASDLSNLYRKSLYLYICLHSICVVVRAYRYKILIGSRIGISIPLTQPSPHRGEEQGKGISCKQIGMGNLTLVTLVRNIFVDLIPARLGALSYIYLLVKRFGLAFEIGASTLMVSILFDFIAVTPLLILSIMLVGFGGAPLSSPLFLISVIFLLAILFLLLTKLVPILRFTLKLAHLRCGPVVADLPTRRQAGLAQQKQSKLCNYNQLTEKGNSYINLDRKKTSKWINIISQKLTQTVDEIEKIQKRKLYRKVFFISLLIRILKYGSLYFLLHSVLASHGFTIPELNFCKVFLAFAGPEIAANLPIHGVGGFGSWELAWVLTFQPMGFTREIAIRTGFIVHGITQVVEYIMGIIAIVILALPFYRKKGQHS